MRAGNALSIEQTTFLLTNDDGWDAPGLAALRRAVFGLGRSHVVAPFSPQSGCAHRITTGDPIAVATIDENCTTVAGTPVDCVRLALHQLVPRPEWILAGINAGGNLGADIHHSGTVAAVREGAIRGVPGIALSHYIARGRNIDWVRAARWARAVVTRLVAIPWEAGTFWNVNLPHPAEEESDPELRFCPLDPSPLPLEYRIIEGKFVYAGDYHQRARQQGTDVDVCFGGRIAVSLVRVPGPGRCPRPITSQLDPSGTTTPDIDREGLADSASNVP
jgi:5'-nucleotidase